MRLPKPVQTSLAKPISTFLKGIALSLLFLFASFVGAPQSVKGAGTELILPIENFGGGGYVDGSTTKELTPKLATGGTTELEVTGSGFPYLVDAIVLDQGGKLDVHVSGPAPNQNVIIAKVILRTPDGNVHSSYRVHVTQSGGIDIVDSSFVR